MRSRGVTIKGKTFVALVLAWGAVTFALPIVLIWAVIHFIIKFW